MRIVAALIAFAAPVFFLTAPLGAQSLEDVFTRMDKAAQQFKSVSADLNRDVHTAIVNEDSRDSGTIKVRREKDGDTRILVDFTGPDAKTVALDASTVSIYYPKMNTVQVYDIGDKRSLVNQFMLLGWGASSSELKATYDVTYAGTEGINGVQAGEIKLVPKSPDAQKQLKEADLWISSNNGLPAQQKFVTSSAGDYMLIAYSNVKVNAALSDNSLKLHYPKGAKIEHPQR